MHSTFTRCEGNLNGNLIYRRLSLQIQKSSRLVLSLTSILLGFSVLVANLAYLRRRADVRQSQPTRSATDRQCMLPDIFFCRSLVNFSPTWRGMVRRVRFSPCRPDSRLVPSDTDIYLLTRFLHTIFYNCLLIFHIWHFYIIRLKTRRVPSHLSCSS